jgi:hypothetical protein
VGQGGGAVEPKPVDQADLFGSFEPSKVDDDELFGSF